MSKEGDPDFKAFQERQKKKEEMMKSDPCIKEEIEARNCLSKEPNCDEILTQLYDCRNFWGNVNRFYQKKYRSPLVLNIKNFEKAKEEYLASLSADKS